MAPNTNPAGMTVAEALHGLVVSGVRRSNRDISLTAASTLGRLERTGPRRITELAAAEGVAQPSMTVLVSGLERSGFVERRRHPADQRVVLVALTAAGTSYLRARRRVGADGFASLIDKLSPDEARALEAATPALQHLLELDSERR